MASNIDITVPVTGNPTTASVRANFVAAKAEIEALQTTTGDLTTTTAGLSSSVGTLQTNVAALQTNLGNAQTNITNLTNTKAQLSTQQNAVSNIAGPAAVTAGKAIVANSGDVLGAPDTFSTKTLSNADNSKVFTPTNGSQTATIPSGLEVAFGCSFNGNVAFTPGSGVTMPAENDLRISGALKPFCSLINIGVNTYIAVGTKT